MKWVQHHDKPGLDDDALRDYIAESHRQAAMSLSKKRQRELGIGLFA